MMQQENQINTTDTITRLRSEKLLSAKVISVNEDSTAFSLQSRLGVLIAFKAFSCYTAPEVGDTVLFVHSDDGYFVTDILARPSSSPARQVYPTGLILTSTEKVSLASKTEIELNSSGATSITTAELSVGALKSRIRILDFVAQITDFRGRFTKLSWMSDWAEQKANLFRQRFKRSDRKVEEQDIQQAGSLVQQVDKTASLRAEHTIIKARKDVQVDGKRIHMG